MLQQAAAKAKPLLLILDDLWSDELYSAINPCIGKSEGSRLLITTRLRDIVADAKTVDLTVLSSKEAAQLLCRTACLGEPAQAQSLAVDAVAQQCGYLPLGLVLAGKMIASYGQVSRSREMHSD